ncbi:MAG: SET domain-containing protein-lysine N-methyltransferase [Planctomycetes bacterium]|nr:SET domain-containing protein-lysine N-methyltransferase [Planctomycetota bacterium]
MEPSTLICIRKVRGKGRGVFAKRAIKKGAIIERVPILLVPITDLVEGLANPSLHRFFYYWSKTHVAMSLGYGSLYNHSFKPNARYLHGKATLTYRALRDIAAGEEITINYNFKPNDKTAMNFKVM